jgi:hypothetical protein
LVEDDFDLILRTRFDCYFNVNKVLSYINYIIQNNCILIPNNWGAGDETHPGGGRICDSFALGTRDAMKVYSKIFDNFISLKTTPDYLINNGVWFVPHSILLHYLRLNNVNYIKADIDYTVTR